MYSLARALRAALGYLTATPPMDGRRVEEVWWLDGGAPKIASWSSRCPRKQRSVPMTTNPTKDDRREQFGSCEVCRTAIFVGDQYGPTDDGIYCEEHTFMLSDVENQLASFASDGTGDGVMRDHAEVLEDLTTIRADLAENGGPQGLIHSVTGAFPQCELVRGLRMTAITYGNVRIAKVRAAFDIHRQAAHSGGVEAIQETSSQIDNGEGHK